MQRFIEGAAVGAILVYGAVFIVTAMRVFGGSDDAAAVALVGHLSGFVVALAGIAVVGPAVAGWARSRTV